MGKKGYGQAGRARAIRAAALLRLWACRRETAGFFAALVLLLNAAVPYWHAGQKLQAFASAFAEPHARHHIASFAKLECHQKAGGTSEKRGGDEAPPNKQSCPLCQALQFFSPGVAQPGLAFVPSAPPAFAALVPSQVELKAARFIAEQGRPRAPPLA